MISMGLPQESVLESMLVVVYINETAYVFPKISNITVHTDDSPIQLPQNCSKNLETQTIMTLYHWYGANNLPLNRLRP